MILQVPAHIAKVETTSDRGYKLSLYTPELSPQEGAVLLALKDVPAFCLFKTGEFDEKEIEALPDFVPEFKGDKSPCQRLRGVLYHVFEADDGKKEEFNAWYRKQMEKIIEHFKDKLR